MSKIKKECKARYLCVACAGIVAAVLGAPAGAQGPGAGHVTFNMVSGSVGRFLSASGDRLQKPGKERITAAGTIATETNRPAAIQITFEMPGRIRIDGARGTAIYDPGTMDQPALQDKETLDTVETFLEDSIDGFFTNHLRGSSRFLGDGYRPAGAGPGTPVYEVLEIYADNRVRGAQGPKARQYWFDSRTGLLRRAVHSIGADSSGGFAEVLWSDWRDVQGARIPFRVERREFGRTTLLVILSSAVISPKSDDGRFSGR